MTSDSSPQSSSGNDIIKIITDDPLTEEISDEYAFDFESYSYNLANIIKGTKPKFAVGIFGKWGTGKTTLMKMIKQVLDKDNEKILTVWFDAWRYEREKNLAVVPFLRQVRIALDNDLNKQKDGKSKRWKKLLNALEKTFDAFIISTEFSVSPAGVPVSTKTNLEKVVGRLKAKGSTTLNNERILLQEHSTDYLQGALNELENARIVVFIDDLDRCTPQNALEVIESIKTFFDLHGIIYVIAMDSDSIDHIIKQKYGEKSNIDGLKYLEKIVQLPFQIPVWKQEDMHGYISKIISKGLEGSVLVKEFQKDYVKELIVRAIEPNPRQVKRFINNIILANKVFTKENVEIDKLIVVQALNFNLNWNRFSELIADDNIRMNFFEEYCKTPRGAWNGKSIKTQSDLDNLTKEGSDNEALPHNIQLIFQELINQKDGSLKSFLDDAKAAEFLRDIERMATYRRALDATKLKEEGEEKPTKEYVLKLLKMGRVREFNDLRNNFYINVPDLSEANLARSYLARANLEMARLSQANLSEANLFYADLSRASLADANLSGANLSHAYPEYAYLSGANLSHANLEFVNFSDANLSKANLSHANLSGASLGYANLSSADLSYSIMIGVLYEDKNLECANANFENAVIDDKKYLKLLSEAKAKNLPSVVKNKTELRQKLESTEWHMYTESILSQSILPD